jgi:type 1 fimbria pilin
MNKQITLFSTLAASLLVSFAAQAADTAELKVKGVIRPSACTPSFTGTNVVDYGTIAAKGLSATAANVLEEKTIAFTVTCDAATKVAVRAIDNKASTVVAGLMTAINSNLSDKNAYGLGAAGGKNIGAYSVRAIVGSFTADGATPDIVADVANNGTWAKTAFGRFHGDGTNR